MFILERLVLSGIIVFGASQASAQITIPPVTQADSGALAKIWAAQAENNIRAEVSKARGNISILRPEFPRDSIQLVRTRVAHSWLLRFEQESIRGLHHDPYAAIAAAAGEITLAQREVASRLANPSLSESDRAYTYFNAVHIFADAKVPTQLAVAEEYLQQLTSMGKQFAPRILAAHLALIEAYYDLGQHDDIMRHGLAIIPLIANVPFIDRDPLLFQDFGYYTILCAAFARDPEGRRHIDALDEELRKAVVPAPELVAIDSSFYYRGRFQARQLKRVILIGQMLGESAPPIVSNAWVNVSDTSLQTKPVNDGKIRILAFGSYTCPGCMHSLPGLQRLHEQFPNIEVIWVSNTEGSWANRSLEPQEEAVFLKDFYLNVRKLTFPIALYLSKRIQQPDGTWEVEPNPNRVVYHQIAKPQIYITDGAGIVRSVFMGYTRDIEKKIQSVVHSLLQEAKPASMAAIVQ